MSSRAEEPGGEAPRPRIYTVGHSSLALDDFLALLERHAIAQLVDVRAFPASRRHPHFAREALAAACAARGIEYRWMPSLGGRRKPQPSSPHTAWREPGFRAYADYLDTREFRDALAELESLGARARTAFVCAEALWWQCHRRMIADALLVAGWDVAHVLRGGGLQAHALPEIARVEGAGIVYDRGATPELPLAPATPAPDGATRAGRPERTARAQARSASQRASSASRSGGAGRA